MDVELRKKIMAVVIRANNEVIDKKVRLNTILSLNLKNQLYRLELREALKLVKLEEENLRKDIEKLQQFISKRTSLLLSNYLFGEVIEVNNKLYAKKGTTSKSPLTHFTVNDLNRGFTYLNRIIIDYSKKEIATCYLYKFNIRTGTLTQSLPGEC